MSNDRQWSVKYRPTTLEQVIGNADAVSRTKTFLRKRNAHAILYHGRSGCGKSTLARIAANVLSEGTKADVVEFNIGSARGIDDIRTLVDQTKYLPKNACRVFILEEVHALTAQAKSALLRPIEDPAHDKVVFILCTDRPWQLDTQILNRTLQIGVDVPTEEELGSFLAEVVSNEKAFPKYSQKAISRICKEIAHVSDYVPRSSLQLLQAAASSYEKFADAKDLIVNSIRRTESATIDKAALLVIGCLYSSQKSLPERVTLLTKLATAHDSMALLNRIMYIHHALFLEACGNGPPAAYYFVKELKPIGGIPSVSRSTKTALILASLKNTLVNVNLDPAQLIIPTLVDVAIAQTKKD